MIFLDTHIIVWLYQADVSKLSAKAIDIIEENDLYVSPIVCLELQYLNEINRIQEVWEEIIRNLKKTPG
jgi:PIN domain nuclease of toxin-antitoxin system